MRFTMKRIALCLIAIVGTLGMADAAQAQWVRYYRPVYRRVYRPVYRPVMRSPRVVYQPTTVFTTRNRPFLGGTVTRPQRVYRRTVVW
jgi:hypothetical protein